MEIKKAIQKTVGRHAARFFMPGHKGRMGRYDVTELEGTDNLHHPTGCIASAQRQAAQAVGADATFFLVGGASAGLHGLILSVCRRGDHIIVARDCHVSVINALVLYGIVPVFVHPRHNVRFGIGSGVHASDVAAALDRCPFAKAVLITSPTYYGVCSDVAAIAQEAHRRNVPLLVDEAHGAHFPFSPLLPASALACHADGVVQSAHKTLPCLTPGAMVHVKGGLLDRERLAEHLRMVQTTSPSYLLLQSIERSVHTVQRQGERRLEQLVDECMWLKNRVGGRVVCVDKQNSGGFDFDPTRLVFHFPEGTEQAAKQLRRRGVIPEMDDGFHIVCIPTVCNEKQDFVRLARALRAASKAPAVPKEFPPLPQTQLVLPPHQAYHAKTEAVSPPLAVGRIAARSVYRTPPCMPLLCPGECITADIANAIDQPVVVVQQ